jgi:hypothetical protein
MKKTILTLVLAVSTLISISQTIVPTYKNAVGYWNTETKQYDFEEWVPSNITFTFYDAYITADDAGHSIYRIVKDLPKYENERTIVNSARCLDENNRECEVGVMEVKGEPESTNIGVIYDGKMFMYLIDLDKMRTLNGPNSRDLKNLNK